MKEVRFLISTVVVLLTVFLCVLRAFVVNASPPKLDPAAWGSDHAGKPVPEYVTGGECLFCHRNDVGPSWEKNRHRQTVREAETEPLALAALKQAPGLQPQAGEVKLVLGGGQRVRFLKPSAAYGKLDLLSTEWSVPRGKEAGRLVAEEKPHWDAKKFADACAGCHATAVDPKTRAFSAVALDCYACHGAVDVNHSKDPGLAYLSKKRKDPARVVTSICAQCHVRTGTSRSTGLPYPNNFVAGDNLFRDFRVDFSDEALARLNPGDRHVLENVRDVVVYGKEETTCLSCHTVHQPSGKKHHRLVKDDICLHCHHATGSMKERKAYEVHSPTCGY